MLQLLNCEFQDINNHILKRNNHTRSMINTNSGECRTFNYYKRNQRTPIDSIETTCQRRNVIDMKIISIFSLSQLFELIHRGVRVLHLVRDPRSNWVSQMKILSDHMLRSYGTVVEFAWNSLP